MACMCIAGLAAGACRRLEQFARKIRSESALWARVIKQAGIKLD